MFLAYLFFKLIFYQRSNTICLFALSWLEVKHKTRHCQGENSSIIIHKMYKEKFIKIVNLQIRKNESTGWKVLKQLFNFLNFWVCASFAYTQKWSWMQLLNLEKPDFIVHF